MAKEGTRTITIGRQQLKVLERYYKEELSKIKYHVSFAEFVTTNAIRNIEREQEENKK